MRMGESKWRQCKLGDLLEIKHGFAFKGEFFSDSGSFVLLSPGNFLEEGGLKMKGDKEKFYTGEFPNEYLLKRNDLLVAMTDLIQNAPILGSPAFIPEDGRFLHNQRLGKVINISQDSVAVEFLYYLLNTTSVRGQIKGSATGSTVRHTSPSRIYDVNVQIPSLPIQRHIVGILSAYDELIENNQQRIKILESMARSIYREWFVHFRFPGHESVPRVSSPIGKIPVGWEVKKLDEIAENMRRNVQKGQLEDSRPLIGLEHIPRKSLALNAWENVTKIESNKLAFKKNEILFGKIRPYFHKVSIAPFDGLCSADTIVIRARHPEYYGFMVACISSEEFVAEASATANGAKMPRANWNVLKKFQIAIPNVDVANKFTTFVINIIAQQQILIYQIQNLRRTRDLLLHRLLSGH